MINGFAGRTGAYLSSFLDVNRNCKLTFAASLLNGLSQGMFLVVFNLYIISMGIQADALGGILSAGPLAQAIGSIPIGFLAEKIGYRKVFIMIYAVSGLAKLVQVYNNSIPLIAGAAFLGGLALAGDFVVRLSFLAENSSPSNRTKIYSMNSAIFSLSLAIGSLVAGYLPNLFEYFNFDLVTAYRYTLYLAGLLAILAIIPSGQMVDAPRLHVRKISLSPYLWGIDRFTVQQAITSLGVGLSIGMISPFMNLYFVYHLGSKREFFGAVSALSIIFTMTALSLGPYLARRLGTVSTVTYFRLLIPVFLIIFAFTGNQYVGSGAFWVQGALFQMTQPLSFAFAMRAASAKAQTAASAWLNVTFWLGIAMVAPVVGNFIVRSDYRSPLFLAGAAVALAGILNQLFFRPVEVDLDQKEGLLNANEA
jgi:MFS family permease